MVEPFITYGYPSRQTVSKLIYKRGCGKVQRRRLPLTDNSIIAGELGKHGISCVEDLIHEVVTCGPKFKEANNFLWPFKLSSPLGGFEIKRHSFAQGFGAFGNREELINSIVKKMLWGFRTLFWVESKFANYKRRNAYMTQSRLRDKRKKTLAARVSSLVIVFQALKLKFFIFQNTIFYFYLLSDRS